MTLTYKIKVNMYNEFNLLLLIENYVKIESKAYGNGSHCTIKLEMYVQNMCIIELL